MEQFPFYPLALALDVGAVNKHCLFFATKNAIFSHSFAHQGNGRHLD